MLCSCLLHNEWTKCILYVFMCTQQTGWMCTKHKPPLELCKTKHQLQKWSPLNTYKHIKHGRLHCLSMTAFIAGARNERPAVQRDNATSRAIITQVCGWDEGSKTATATGMPLRCCLPHCQQKKKITGFISRRIKCGLRINGFLNTQHHLHKKQQAGYVGGLVYFSLNVQSEWDAWSEQVWKEADKAVKEHISSWIHKSLQGCNGKQAVETFFCNWWGSWCLSIAT